MMLQIKFELQEALMKAEMSLVKWKEKLRKWQSWARPLFTIINSEQMRLKIIALKAK